MEYWLDVFLCSGVVAIKLIGIVLLALSVEGIVYRTTRFSIYNFLMKKLVVEQLNK